MLAVVGMVVAFSLSSTLVKRAESPGVLVAFWRMVCVSVVWNAVLWTTGRHITMANVRQAFLPGVFFGLNLAVFFAGATHNGVANAALIGSLAPFFIVPVGAWLFGEYIDPRAARRVPLGAGAERAVGARLGDHQLDRRRRRDAVHGLRLQRRDHRDARDRRPARRAHRAERPMSGAREPGTPQSGLRARLGATRGGSSGIFG